MATAKKMVPAAQGEEFKKLANSAYNTYVQQRSTAGGLLQRSGSMESNAELSDLIRYVAQDQGIPLRDMLLSYAGNAAKGTAAIYVEKPGAEGAVQPRMSKAGYYRFHLGALFAETPSLRPKFKAVDVTASLQVDAKGVPCIVLQLAEAREHHKEARSGSGASGKGSAAKAKATPQADAEATQQADAKADAKAETKAETGADI